MSGEPRNLLDPAEARTVSVIVAHPDDETLWTAGLLLSHPAWTVSIASLCRAGDPDRAPKFREACARLGAVRCEMADLDDGPEQLPLEPQLAAETVQRLSPGSGAELLITHSPKGEYTRHRRHEETGLAVAGLWAAGKISPREVWMFAYEDAGRTKPPEAIDGADLTIRLTGELFLTKFRMITEIYGFDTDSWEAKATPRVEAFWRFTGPGEIAERFGIDPSPGEPGGGRR